MTQTLREFINEREADIHAQIKRLNVELKDVQAAKSAISDEDTAELDGINRRAQRRIRRHMKHRMTQREMVLSVLDKAPDGMTCDAIVSEIEKQHDVSVPAPNVSVLLSRAKTNDLVFLVSGTRIWRSAKHYDLVRQKRTAKITRESETDERPNFHRFHKSN